jgi:predicted Ser/Thr protein kinase
MLTEPEHSRILSWIDEATKTQEHRIGKGNQGNVYRFGRQQPSYAIKVSRGWGLGRLVREAMLRNEYRAYCQLSKVEGVPRCYGLLEGRYLVIEHVEGKRTDQLEAGDRDLFFDELMNLIQRLHAAGVAHGDLSKKKNILVVDGGRPMLIDFGLAIRAKSDGSMFNRYLFKLFRQSDYNGWVRLKHGRPELAPEEDRKHFVSTVYDSVRGLRKRFKIARKAYRRV